MNLSNISRLSIIVILAMSLSFTVSSCGNDDEPDPTPTNNNNQDPDPDPVVKQKLTIYVTSNGSPVLNKDVKLAKSYTDLDQGNLIGKKTLDPQGVVVFTDLAPGNYAFECTVAGGPLGTKRNTATIEEGFDAKGYINF